VEKLGLIAGNRKFPLLLCEACRKQGREVVVVAVKGDTSTRINKLASKVHWLNLSEFSSMFEFFRSEGIRSVVMAGQISPRRLFSDEITRDERLRVMLAGTKDKRADTIFGAVADMLRQEGFELIDSTVYVKEYFPGAGVLTREEPDAALAGEISFGMRMAKAVALLDIGQTIAVKDKAIVAVEAFEGTDNLIRRAGRVARKGITVVKVSKPNQDARFDVPVVGLRTIRSCVRAGARCLAIEAGKTLFIDKEESVALANRKNLVIAAV
jgi:UDP-2,3-diacylglucosamine hydrolase